MKKNLFYLLSLFTLFSCNNRNLAYFSDLPEATVYKENITNASEPSIQSNDILGITVSSSNAESNVLFNTAGGKSVGQALAGSMTYDQNTGDAGYLVDPNGYIDFPVLGRIKLGGLTKQEAKAKMIGELNKYVKDPAVNIRFLNFRVTVIGEVKNPSTFTIPSEKINVLEALGLAGDMTPYGKRDNVLLIREEKGERSLTRINLNSKEVLNSPNFYLHQNDVVYVEPNSNKAAQATNNTRYLTLALTIISATSLIIYRLF
ncbi:polysaccharide biosynthesis/export family protein [Pontibacter sp. E15-1]|uniref:polysaccharide biosynthesis/export family protein n=1 Tax=Pontibacter sp. E15-1 TaxID=2919918 RepID=UPI001F4FA233|nr:polysaccharide biosynthesis/export family protein [Pontibacter sp. E15-1]MCJ8164424.1 polysaccharide biosynthesis/export family protein [Pontibacter sp. E15-1]